MTVSKILAAALLFVFVSVSGAFAECDVCKAANEKEHKDYLNGVGARATQGATNVAFFWMEPMLEPVKVCNDDGKKYVENKEKFSAPNAVGAFSYGIFSGLGGACYRLATGAGELLTAPWPQRVMGPSDCEVCKTEDMKAKGYIS